MSDFSNALERAEQHSPYLAESLEIFPDLALELQAKEPEHLLQTMFDGIPKKVGTLDGEMALLRQLKRRAHLIIAVADIGRHWNWSEVTERLTQLADFCLRRILGSAAMSQNIVIGPDNHVDGLFILAVGKYGARELNYSSDVDFNVFYDPDKIVVPNPARAERTLIKTIQGVVRGMEAITEDGYIFRTDLRLRPDPRSNAIAVSTRTAERYYETLGQNWERAAMIKARVCAGDMVAGEQFINTVLRPFIWRKNMDYAAIEDILAIKRQIHSRKDVGNELNIDGHHLKLGVGGIREIEFYAQVQQLILGGRHPELRSIRTVDALRALAKQGFVDKGPAALLTESYGYLRTAEHAVQMIRDEQTHKVPDNPEDQARFAGLMGESSFSELSDKLSQVFSDVRATYRNLFPEADTLSSSAGNLVFTGVEPDPDTLRALKKLGFKKAAPVWYDMANWLGGRVRATRSEKARELLTALAPEVIESCAATGQADKAFYSFGEFFSQLSMGVSLLSMFHQRPEFLRYVISLMTLSPMVTEWIARRPSILDALSDPSFLKLDSLSISFNGKTIHEKVDFEEALNITRRWAREARFRISAALLSENVTPDEAGSLHSALAQSIIEKLVPIAIFEAGRRTGKIEGDIAVLGMGKLASRDLNLNSDLDIMVIYEPADSESGSMGKYTKVTQRLVSALSSITEEGGLYEVDMALRPSGRSGPVAVTCEAFRRYYREKAWSWEFMALTRSRVISATSNAFFKQVAALSQSALLARRDDLDMSADIADMLQRLRREKNMTSEMDLKNAIGGIRDIEFIAQKMFLQNRFESPVLGQPIGEILVEYSSLLAPGQASELKTIYDYYLSLQQQKSVWVSGKSAVLEGDDLRAFSQYLKFKNEKALLKDVKQKQRFVKSVVDDFLFTKE